MYVLSAALVRSLSKVKKKKVNTVLLFSYHLHFNHRDNSIQDLWVF